MNESVSLLSFPVISVVDRIPELWRVCRSKNVEEFSSSLGEFLDTLPFSADEYKDVEALCECLAKTTTAYAEGKISDDVVKEVVALKKTYKEELLEKGIEKGKEEAAKILAEKANMSLREARELLGIVSKQNSTLTDMTLQ